MVLLVVLYEQIAYLRPSGEEPVCLSKTCTGGYFAKKSFNTISPCVLLYTFSSSKMARITIELRCLDISRVLDALMAVVITSTASLCISVLFIEAKSKNDTIRRIRLISCLYTKG